MSKSIELSRSGRTIFRKAKHEKPRRFYLRSCLLYLFLQSIPSLSLSLSPFSLALKHELLHLTHVPCFNTRTRIFSRCTRLHIDANAVSHSTREGEPRFSIPDPKVSLLSRGCLEPRLVFRANRFLFRPEENVQSRGEGEFSRIIAREVLLAGE